MLHHIAMDADRIDFISSYCDRWCERCAYTLRCSAFAVQAAIAMCGNAKEGFELALGTLYPGGNEGLSFLVAHGSPSLRTRR